MSDQIIKIENLETRLAHLENFLIELNQVVVKDSQTIYKLAKEQERFKQQLKEILDQKAEPENRPPHYLDR